MSGATVHMGPVDRFLTESSISHLNIQDIGVNSHATIDAALTVIANHIADGTIHFTVGSISHTAIQDIGVNTHPAIDAHIADGTIHFTEGSIDHGNLLGLADDDHINYFFALGRAGGQFMIGGTNPADGITMQSNTTNTGAGRINMLTPIEFGAYSSSTAVYGFNYAAVESFTGAFVGGGLNFSGTISHTATTFIYESFRGAPSITSNANNGFRAYTVLQALPSLIAGAGAGHNPLNVTVINAGPRFNNPNASARTSATAQGFSFSPQINPSVNGAVMNITNINCVSFSPTWNTVAGSTANFGTMRGLWAKNPAQALFGSSAGTERGAAYYGLEVDNITIQNGFGTLPVAAMRSSISAGVNRYVILNAGGAESEFGFGDIHLNDDTWVKFGNTLAAPDVIVGWQATQSSLVFSTFFGAGNNSLYLRNSGDTWTFQQNNGGTADIGLGFNVNAISFGVVVPTPDAMNWFVRFEGPNNRLVHNAGSYADVWWTAGGTIDVDGLAVTDLSSFRIDANVTALNGGTVQDQTGLYVAGMGFPGSGLATRIQSMRIVGRARIDGAINLTSYSPVQITANVNDYQLGISNAQRSINLLTSDAAYNITGIDITGGNTYGQPGDRICLHNVGAFPLTITHQDAASLAVHRIITSTGVGYVIGPDECVWLWYDDTGTARWRMQEGTGA